MDDIRYHQLSKTIDECLISLGDCFEELWNDHTRPADSLLEYGRDRARQLGWIGDRRLTPPQERKGPKDFAVQRLAGERLLELRDPAQGRVFLSSLDSAMSYEDIGKRVGVSRERIRDLYATLCPEQYRVGARVRSVR